jgi:hypothetical protein
MKNVHLRFGWLTYVKSTEKTTTSTKLRLALLIGEVLPDAPRQVKAHLMSVIGGDTQVAAVSAAISLGPTPGHGLAVSFSQFLHKMVVCPKENG